MFWNDIWLTQWCQRRQRFQACLCQTFKWGSWAATVCAFQKLSRLLYTLDSVDLNLLTSAWLKTRLSSSGHIFCQTGSLRSFSVPLFSPIFIVLFLWFDKRWSLFSPVSLVMIALGGAGLHVQSHRGNGSSDNAQGLRYSRMGGQLSSHHLFRIHEVPRRSSSPKIQLPP